MTLHDQPTVILNETLRHELIEAAMSGKRERRDNSLTSDAHTPDIAHPSDEDVHEARYQRHCSQDLAAERASQRPCELRFRNCSVADT